MCKESFTYHFFSLIYFSSSCSTESDSNVEEGVTTECIEYFSVDHDTTELESIIQTSNGILNITSKRYSLNDSAVANKVYISRSEEEMESCTSVAHNFEIELTIANDTSELKRVKVTKETFAECMNSTKLDRMYMYGYWFDSSSDTTCIMSVGIGVPDTDDACHVKFSVSVLPASIGEIICEEVIPLEYGE